MHCLENKKKKIKKKYTYFLSICFLNGKTDAPIINLDDNLDDKF